MARKPEDNECQKNDSLRLPGRVRTGEVSELLGTEQVEQTELITKLAMRSPMTLELENGRRGLVNGESR